MKNKSHLKTVLFVCIAILLICAVFYYIHSEKKIRELKLAQQPQAPVIYRIEMVSPSLPTNDSYQETLEFAKIFRQQIENNGVNKLFWDDEGNLIKKKESDVHEMFKLVSSKSDFARSYEPRNGLGAPDFTFTKGDIDKTVLEIKLASNPALKYLPKQVEAYLKANTTNKSVKIIVAHTEKHHKKALKTIESLGLMNDESIVLIDASFNKETGSKKRA